MNAVNLLPVKHRPRTPTGGQQGSAYVVIGVLGAILAMALVYALTVNGINSRRSQVADAKAETVRTKARATALAAYGNFSKVKQERVQSIKDLAQGRIDWERLARGLARVLPADVWLLTANASASGPPSSTSSSSSSSSTSGTSTGAGEPEVEVAGCAPGHSEIAVTLVRLRELSGAKDVKLNEITAPEQSTGAASGSVTSAPNSGGSAGGGGQDCGTVHGKTAYKWDATITFQSGLGATPGSEKVPASLGGGS